MSHDTRAPSGLKAFDFEKDLVANMALLRRLAIALTKSTDEANDYVQQTCEKALANREKFTPGTNMAAWLSTILRNDFYSHKRKATREIGGDEDFWASIAEKHATHPTHAERMDALSLFYSLPPDKLAPIVDTDVMGLGYIEQAKAANVAEGTIKSRVSRAREYAREVLERDPQGKAGPPRKRRRRSRPPSQP